MFDQIVGWIFVVAGAGILAAATIDLVSAALSGRWPQVQGVIVRSALEANRDGEGTTYRADVRYEYQVMEKHYIGSRTRYGDRSELPHARASKAILEKYPAGARVRVHYNPDDHSESVLEPGVNPLLIIGYGIGALFVALGILMLRR